ncbi:DUF4124 domain-containing protein [Xylophilus ampelinus]|uniref:Uncharacterized protein DUF4124 n=1 Tax=Xylophilus ampelinus TaxID=54067 RepID=A0A318SEE1_9BURK|nr:DUF4124 domain-containing protein [Xylophilus ampelinus]MCS4511611.1 DUF4124 domain-containing protein [Xylophilus ampelinus]PYE74216.1 uncharacterized protein DUF4124 [Xylophilus ampelinus]
MKLPARFLALALVCACPLVASAQWQWMDKDGRKVFSDRPPPADIPQRNILKQPGGMAAPPPAAAPAPQAATAPARPVPKDAELEARKKEAEDAEAAKAKAEADNIARARQENCQRARQAKVSMDAGMPIGQVGADGKVQVMDNAARAAEAQRVQSAMTSNCG